MMNGKFFSIRSFLLRVYASTLGLMLIACTSFVPVNQPSGSLMNFNIPNTEFKSLGIGEGRGCESAVFGFFTLTNEFAYQFAVDVAVKSKGGDILIQTSTDASYFVIPPFYHKRCVVVKGVVLKISERMKEVSAVHVPANESEPVALPVTKKESKIKYFDIAKKGGKAKALGKTVVKTHFRIDRYAQFPSELKNLQVGSNELAVVRPQDSKADVLMYVRSQHLSAFETQLGQSKVIQYKYLTDFNDDGRYIPVIDFVGFDDEAN